eukprot:2364850-Rhodomonas_salina.2
MRAAHHHDRRVLLARRRRGRGERKRRKRRKSLERERRRLEGRGFEMVVLQHVAEDGREGRRVRWCVCCVGCPVREALAGPWEDDDAQGQSWTSGSERGQQRAAQTWRAVRCRGDVCKLCDELGGVDCCSGVGVRENLIQRPQRARGFAWSCTGWHVLARQKKRRRETSDGEEKRRMGLTP